MISEGDMAVTSLTTEERIEDNWVPSEGDMAALGLYHREMW